MVKNKVFEGGKSFFVYARNIKNCFDCGYCVLESVDYLKQKEGFRNVEIGKPPGNIHPMLKKIPVAVNNSYGDPGIQWKDTVSKLKNLEKSGHTGPVGIITKSKVTEDMVETIGSLNINSVFLTSISKLPGEIEKVDYGDRIEGIKNIVERDIPLLTYFRPVIPGFNSDEKTVTDIMKDISEIGVKRIVYSGLMGKKEVISKLKKRTNKKISPPEGYSKWQKYHKLLNDDTRKMIEKNAKRFGINVFRKTSCGVTDALGRKYDYNIHFTKPSKYNCKKCVNLKGCTEKASNGKKEEISYLLDEIGVKFEVIHREKEKKCELKDLCEKNCSSCENSKGTILKLEGKHTQGFISIIRWLTAMIVTADTVVKSHRIPEREMNLLKQKKKVIR